MLGGRSAVKKVTKDFFDKLRLRSLGFAVSAPVAAYAVRCIAAGAGRLMLHAPVVPGCGLRLFFVLFLLVFAHWFPPVIQICSYCLHFKEDYSSGT